jgi:hypothetical protein
VVVGWQGGGQGGSGLASKGGHLLNNLAAGWLKLQIPATPAAVTFLRPPPPSTPTCTVVRPSWVNGPRGWVFPAGLGANFHSWPHRQHPSRPSLSRLLLSLFTPSPRIPLLHHPASTPPPPHPPTPTVVLIKLDIRKGGRGYQGRTPTASDTPAHSAKSWGTESRGPEKNHCLLK